MSGRGAGAAAASAVVALGLASGWALSGEGPGFVFAFVLVGLPYVVAATVLGWFVARTARGADGAARFLALATAGRRGSRAEWGAAMRAELASVTGRRERWRFAVGCALTAVRTGWGRGPLLVAAGSFLGFAVLTFVASRVMLTGDRVGILAGVLGPGLVFLVVGLVAARSGRSFRAGLESGVVGLLAALAGALVVVVPEAVNWYREAGVWIIDGDAAAGGIPGPGAAVRNALGGVTYFYLLFNVPWPVLGAALGTWRRRRPETAGPPAVVPTGSPGIAPAVGADEPPPEGRVVTQF